MAEQAVEQQELSAEQAGKPLRKKKDRQAWGENEREGGTLLLEPGGNPPDPPLRAWLADGEEALGPA